MGLGLARKEPTVDWRPAANVIADGTPDPEVLRICARDSRVLVSRDLTTMGVHFAEFILSSTSSGVILVPSSLSIGEAIERLLLMWERWEASDMQNQIWWLPQASAFPPERNPQPLR